MNTLENSLKDRTQAEVYFDAIHKQAYSVDASIYEIEPMGVVIPKTKEDIQEIIRIANEFKVSLIPRGAATGITGSCLGNGLIVDISKYLNQILEINYEEEYVVCQPGVVQDDLNRALSAKGYRLGPDTSTGNRATIGGMLANNAAGAHSLLYGKMIDHVLEVEMALADGECVRFMEVDEKSWQSKANQENPEGRIYREILRIKEIYEKPIRQHIPNIPRKASGYNLEELYKFPHLNVSKLIVGSEGSLGIVTEMKVRISKNPGLVGLCVLHFNSIEDGMRRIPELLKFQPIALEMIDRKIIEMGRISPSMRGKLGWLKGDPEMVFVAEFSAGSREELDHKLSQFANTKVGYAQVCLTDNGEMASVWEVRKAGLGLLLSKRTYSRAIAFIEDVSIAPDKLADFMREFLRYLESKGKTAGIYGHVGSGCMHVRPYIDLRKEHDVELMVHIMENVSTMVLKQGGAMSGEHGDGRIRTWLNKKMFGKDVYQAFIDLKTAFDPRYVFNPGVIVDGPNVIDHLRLSPKTEIQHFNTFMNFTREGGFSLSADLCNGNGACRKKEGVMCPSFQATGNEYDTTRARAQALRSIINGRVPRDELAGEGLHDVLDLCLQCKGCKTECPSQVDMAKMKAEVLYHYHRKHGTPLRSLFFGYVGRLNALASPFTSLFNRLIKTKWTRNLLSRLGITPHRELPTLAEERFSKWFKHLEQKSLAKKVVLFNDTYNEFNYPEIGKSAVSVLNAMGYEVIVPEWSCCGRPMISKGLLPQARKAALRLIDRFYGYAEKEIPIVGLEPSCILTLRDELVDLVGEYEKATAIAKMSVTFDEFVAAHLKELSVKETVAQVKVHGHCHQKAIVGMKPTLDVLRAIPGFSVEEINSGCCGLAGSFGYEKEHYEISMRIGELKLLPFIRNCTEDAIIVADGVSCRSQIAHGAGRHGLHLAEVLAKVVK